MLGPKTSVEKWHFLVWNQITQPINPNPYPNQTPSKDSTKKYPSPPPGSVDPHISLTTKSLPFLHWTEKFTWYHQKRHWMSRLQCCRRQRIKKKKQSAYGFVLTQNSIGNAIFMTNIRCVMLIHLLNDNLRASDTICVNFCISCTDQRPFLHKCFKISVLYFSFSKPLSNALEYL